MGRSRNVTILAKSDAPISIADSRLMVRALLNERFGLRVRTEARDRDVYALTANAMAKLGPNLQRSRSDCAALSRARRAGTRPLPVPPAGERCGLRGGGLGGGEVGIQGIGTLEDIIGLMARGPEIDRPIVDRTGLGGTFEVELRWASQRGAATSDSPSLFTAVREQLGLEFQPVRTAVPVVVIVSAERPQLD